MPTQIEMRKACWLFYEGRTGEVDDGVTNIGYALRSAFRAFCDRYHWVSAGICDPDRFHDRWDMWSNRSSHYYQAELERLVSEYREPPPDYTDPAQAVRLMEIVVEKISIPLHTACHAHYKPGKRHTAYFDQNVYGVAESFGEAVLTACYNAIPEGER